MYFNRGVMTNTNSGMTQNLSVNLVEILFVQVIIVRIKYNVIQFLHVLVISNQVVMHSTCLETKH